MDIAALLVAIVSVLVAAWALFDNRKSSRALLAVELKLARLESARELDRQLEKNTATVRAKFEQLLLVVTNAGPQPAYNVAVFIDGRPVVEDARFYKGAPMPDVLAPGALHSYSLDGFDGMQKMFRVRLTWTTPDDSTGGWEANVPTW